MSRSRAALVSLAFMAALGCGYRFTASGAGFPQGIHKVFAPVIVNRTAEPGLEGIFTEALREQLAQLFAEFLDLLLQR